MPMQLCRGARRRSLRRRRSIGQKRLSSRISLESLEPRYLCATDLQLLDFSANGNNLLVDYHISNADAAPFDIAIYRSHDGSTLGNLLQSQRVTASAARISGENHQIGFAPSFADEVSDYFLVVVLDANAELSESNETNNSQQLGSGIFLTTDGTVHIHGSMSADALTLNGGSTIGANLNATAYSWSASVVSRIHVRLHGGDDAMTISGSLSFPISGWGGDGNDTLIGGSGNDVLRGGQGNDVIEGGDGEDWLYGDDAQIWGDAIANGGDDSLWGNAGNDWLFGEGGADVVYGGAGNDYAYGGYGDDHVYSGSSNVSGSEYVFGDQGDDHLYLESSLALYYDNLGSNVIHGYGGNGLPWSLAGSALSVNGTSDSNSISFGTEYFQGNYWLTLGGARVAPTNSIGSLIAYGGDGDDTIDLTAVTSEAFSSSFTTYLYGGAGHDTLRGSFAADQIDGDSGNDWLYGYGGNDTLHGQEGNDHLEGGDGQDYLYGGDGDDMLYGENYGGYGYGGYGYGGYGYGGYGYGGYGTSEGGGGTDYLFGGNGNDILDGGAGNDVLDGGSGIDTFTNSSSDTVLDRPSILGFLATYLEGNSWLVKGHVTDDGVVAGRTVFITGYAVISCILNSNGDFEATISAPETAMGWLYANFEDIEGLAAVEVATCFDSG